MTWEDGKDAMSFSELNPPNDAEEIGRVVHQKNTYIYYRDAAGNLYYDTVRGQRFKRKMEEAKRRHRLQNMEGKK